jgi:branched-chain amino acid aminotransferase
VTPPLTGTLLEGVTRDSVLQLARDQGMQVAERPVTISEVMTAARNGTLREVFGTGTAAVISPVGELAYKDERLRVHDGEVGPLAQRLYDDLSDIQRGRRPDWHGWMVPVEG